MPDGDVLDAVVDRLANDDYNHVPAEVLRERLAAIRQTRRETRMEEWVDALVTEVRDALHEPGDPEYGPAD